ncbi:S8 family serine peptidase [Algivirga pacifica]|uniref:Fibronectin type-III domain-containing protein n=1 Tax=Algivirga pacifica TaxID=1162670 RepID=A0ABP9DJ21_9BACT
MKQILSKTFKAFACAVGLLAFNSNDIMAQVPAEAAYVNGVGQGVIRVKFKENVNVDALRVSQSSAGTLRVGMTAFDAQAATFGATTMRRVFPYDARFEHKLRKHGLHLWYEIHMDASQDEISAVKAFANIAEVSMAEPMYETKLIEEGAFVPAEINKASEAAAFSNGETVEMPFNDQYLDLQWHYHNNGTAPSSVAGADANVFDAWKIETGKSHVIVAVHDEGIDTDHEDLAANMWVNELEANGQEGVDDDGNGYIDDIHGYSFSYDRGPLEPQQHGTHVAGTVAAVNNNGVGVAGVAGGSGNGDGVRIMGLQILSGPFSNTAASYVYAANNGAVISQNSWGYLTPGYVSQAVLDGIDYFIEEAGDYPGSPMKGGIVIFAAGNSDSDEQHYPGYYHKTVSVASLGPANKRAYYSNYGKWVDIAAPGGDVSLGTEAGVLSTLPDNQYGFFQGTSMAAPHVAGMAALMVSKFGNEAYTVEELKSQMMTSINRIDELNAGYEGLLGVGTIDAVKALATDGGYAPAAIADLASAGASMDFIQVSWTSVADEDDSTAFTYKLYYHTESITESNLTEAMMLEVAGVEAAGTSITHKIADLAPSTTYYVAIQAIDRWGNASTLSNVVTEATNAGPDIAVDPVVFDIDMNTLSGTSFPTSWTIQNQDEGLLEWSATWAHYSATLANVTIPASNNPIKASDAKLGVPFAEATPMTVGDDLPQFEEQTLRHFENTDRAYTLGYGDETVTHTTATMFEIAYGQVFNLTHIKTSFMLASTDAPAVIEIKQGWDMNTAKTLHTQEIVGRTSSYGYTYDVRLDKQLKLTGNGGPVWVLTHIAAGVTRLDPLVWRDIDSVSKSNYSYISFDGGDSWEVLASLIQREFGVVGASWPTELVSKEAFLGDYLYMSKKNGTVDGNSTFDASVTLYPNYLANGTYTSNFFISSNDFDERNIEVPVTVNVSNHPHQLAFEDVYNVGAAQVGTTKEAALIFANYGMGKFDIASATSSNAKFVIESQPASVAAKTQGQIVVSFTPDMAQNENAVITLTDNSGATYNFNVSATGTSPSEITLTPDTLTVDLAVESAGTGSFTIENTGDYPLSFAFPKFSEKEVVGVNLHHTFGYTYDTTAFDWVDISTTGEDITEFFAGNPDNFQYEVDLGFDFPLYDGKVSSVFVTDYGVLNTRSESKMPNNTPYLNTTDAPNGFISAMFERQINVANGGNIYWKRQEGMLIVQYENVSVNYNTPVTFQIILMESGDVHMNYKQVNSNHPNLIALRGDGWKYRKNDFAAYSGSWRDEVYNFTEVINADSSSIVIRTPGAEMISNLSVTDSIIPVGASTTVTFDIETAGLAAGTKYQKLQVISNDPTQRVGEFVLVANLTGGTPDLAVSSTAIDMGTYFVGNTVEETLEIKSTGSAPATIDEISFTQGLFAIDIAAPVSIEAGRSIYPVISASSATVADLVDTLLVIAGTDTLSVALNASIVNAPAIAVATDTIQATLAYGDSVVNTLTVENTGLGEMEVMTYGTSWATVVDAAGDTPIDYDYMVKDNMANLTAGTIVDTEAPVFEWIDAMAMGEEILGVDGFRNPWGEIALPFSFEYYGKTYDKVYIANSGVMTFLPNQRLGLFGGQFGTTLPSNDPIAAMIAPLWAKSWVNKDLRKNSGIYYWANEEMAVFQWEEILTQLGDGMTYQVILYRNGSFKIQYKSFPNSRRLIGLSLVGIEDDTQTRGKTISSLNQEGIVNHMAISFAPAKKYTVAASSSKDFNVVFDGAAAWVGDYTGTAKLVTNVPGTEEIEIPVATSITGEKSMIAAPESVDMGELIAYEKNGSLTSFEVEFDITNTSNSMMYINDFSLETPDADVELSMGLRFVLFDFWGSKVIDEFRENGNLEGSFNGFNTTYIGGNIAPGETRTMKAIVTPGTGTAATYSNNIVINSGDYSVSVPFSYEVVLPPVIEITATELSVEAETASEVQTQTFVVSNANGNSTLDFTVGVDYLRERAAAMAMNQSLEAPQNAMTAADMRATSIMAPMATVADSANYNEIIEYNTDTISDNALGFGAGTPFISGTAFTAPEGGFKLSHVRTWYRPTGLENGDIKVTIAVGEDINTAKVLHEETFTTVTSKEDANGGFEYFELAAPQQFLAGERFYIVLSYSFGAALPQGFTYEDEITANTFFFPSDGQWWDVTSIADFAYAHYMVAALEETAGPDSWLTLDAYNGSVAAGDSTTITATFDANNAFLVDHYAVLNIESNDPVSEGEMINMHMHVNQAPAFTAAADTAFGYEADTLWVPVMVADAEGDMITLTASGDLTADEVVAVDGGFNVSFVSDYTMAGTYNVSFTATDEHGIENTTAATIIIEDVNRAPAFTVPASIEVNSIITTTLMIADLANDADGDELEFTYEVEDNTIAQVVESGDEVLVIPFAVGNTNVTITANDGNGGITSTVVEINVILVSGINDAFKATTKLMNYPNPVAGSTTFQYNLPNTGQVTLDIFTLTGVKMATVVNGTQAAGTHEVNFKATDLNRGMYFYMLTVDGQAVGSGKLIKE